MSEDALFDTNDMTSSKRYLHTPSEFARKKLIYVQETGRLKSIKPHVSSRSNLESYLFLIVMSGSGRVSFDGTDYSIKAGECAFIDCRKKYEHCSDEDSQWELKWVHMDGALLADYYAIFIEKNGKVPVFRAADVKKYSDLLDDVMAKQNGKDITSEYISHSLLTTLVTNILVETINEGNKKLNPDVLNSIRETVNARFKEEDLLERVCGEYDMDEITINRQFKEKYGIEEEDFFSAELEIVPAGPARDYGMDRSMIMGYGHDDRVCAYTSLIAMLDVKDVDKTSVCLLVDKEEIGSVGATGMHSKFFENMVAEVLNCLGDYSEIKLRRALTNSKMLSSDVSAAFDPLYAAAFEKKNAAFLGRGMVFNKFTGSRGKSGSNDCNAEFLGELRSTLEKHEVNYQSAELGKVDVGGGGTIAYILAQYGMEVVDSGIPVLSMHAPWEIVSKADVYETMLGYKAFLIG